MEVKVGNYLVYIEGTPCRVNALEWNKGKGWSKCQKEGLRWYDSSEPFNKNDRDGVLKHFALQDWKDEFPWGRILAMSPAELIGVRRAKEKEMHLEKHEAFRDGSTNKLPAEDFG